jgi:hypothetical protein
MRKVQGNQKKGQGHGDLREPEAQAKAGLIRVTAEAKPAFASKAV